MGSSRVDQRRIREATRERAYGNVPRSAQRTPWASTDGDHLSPQMCASLFLTLMVIALGTSACAGSPAAGSHPASYAIYGELAQGSNKLMQSGLNRRVFNKVEAQAGTDIKLDDDGSINVAARHLPDKRLLHHHHANNFRSTRNHNSTATTRATPFSTVWPTNMTQISWLELITIGSVQELLNRTPESVQRGVHDDQGDAYRRRSPGRRGPPRRGLPLRLPGGRSTERLPPLCPNLDHSNLKRSSAV